MTTIRAGLRHWVTAWLVFQVASLSALVPRACCVAHRPAVAVTPHSCHESAAAQPCPMPAADGTPCPMHRGQGDAGEKPATQCSMRGMCDGPVAALFALLSTYGVPAERFEMAAAFHTSSAALDSRESLTSRLASPDPPPPRA